MKKENYTEQEKELRKTIAELRHIISEKNREIIFLRKRLYSMEYEKESQ